MTAKTYLSIPNLSTPNRIQTSSWETTDSSTALPHSMCSLGGTDAFVLGSFLYLLWDAESQILEGADRKTTNCSKTQTRNWSASLASHCAEKRVAIKQSKLPNTVCSMRSELSPLRLSCAAWAVSMESTCKLHERIAGWKIPHCFCVLSK